MPLINDKNVWAKDNLIIIFFAFFFLKHLIHDTFMHINFLRVGLFVTFCVLQYKGHSLLLIYAFLKVVRFQIVFLFLFNGIIGCQQKSCQVIISVNWFNNQTNEKKNFWDLETFILQTDPIHLLPKDISVPNNFWMSPIAIQLLKIYHQSSLYIDLSALFDLFLLFFRSFQDDRTGTSGSSGIAILRILKGT